MRSIIATGLLFLLALPALAGGGWYSNSRFGFDLVLPDTLSLAAEADSSDAASFASANGQILLTVWGGHIVMGDFVEDMSSRLELLDPESWNISLKVITPDEMSFSGSKDGQVIFVRAIALCENQYAFFQLGYPLGRLHELDGMVEGLVKGFEGTRECG